CPFFMPMERLENGSWPHPSRLPLGGGWSGHCTAPGHENTVPSQDDLREGCNLGYAATCRRLPRERVWDSVRFGARTVSMDRTNLNGGQIQIRYVCERDHLPVEHGTLMFDAMAAHWELKHADDRVQRMAECFLASYVEKRKKREVNPALAS
ncbi:MAG: hypothetical protein WBW36_17645, partial [Candidatus Sulfotelmatobacter sp.]